ncbi:hypothetical protein PMIN03_000566 [Paraphaeosphaeria minitans]|uniref:Uncharacterized protein n=1 Tax=Paraphaeosphaeria minitans TaxID=565426 RepID=A0A9P6KWD4_9PLEO|nr:hypothetical protein PMIN01_00368 [Paraphaeosphaeria minitans]
MLSTDMARTQIDPPRRRRRRHHSPRRPWGVEDVIRGLSSSMATAGVPPRPLAQTDAVTALSRLCMFPVLVMQEHGQPHCYSTFTPSSLRSDARGCIVPLHCTIACPVVGGKWMRMLVFATCTSFPPFLHFSSFLFLSLASPSLTATIPHPAAIRLIPDAPPSHPPSARAPHRGSRRKHQEEASSLCVVPSLGSKVPATPRRVQRDDGCALGARVLRYGGMSIADAGRAVEQLAKGGVSLSRSGGVGVGAVYWEHSSLFKRSSFEPPVSHSSHPDSCRDHPQYATMHLCTSNAAYPDMQFKTP